MLYVLGDAFSSALKGSQTSADHAAVSTDLFVVFAGGLALCHLPCFKSLDGGKHSVSLAR